MKSISTDFTSRLIDYTESLKYFAYTLTKNIEDSNDLTQETILKALIYENKFRDDTNLKAWLFTIMKNIFINNYRREKKVRLLFDGSTELYYLNIPETSKQLDPEKKLEHKEVLNKMMELDSDYKTPLKMYFDGYKYKEIADELGLPLGTIKSRIFLGRKELALKLEFGMAC